ncbi:MAG: hypothetical protein FJ216_11090 [Ignavibacteria bacterium]|nr:hypothetical protein [Ignavibacteria bacterium]
MKTKILNFQKNGALGILQISTPEINTFNYITFSKALQDKLIEIKEISDVGSVNNIFVINRSNEFVFFMDGDILIGAKQNRVLNTSVLLAPESKTEIPVSCIESGRWRFSSPGFRSTNHSVSAFIRKDKAKDVTDNLKKSQRHCADQRKVWDNVEKAHILFSESSPTSNFTDIYENRRHDFDGFIRNLKPFSEANGIAVFIRNNLINLDIFNRLDVYQEYFPKLLRGTMMETCNLRESDRPLERAEAEYKIMEFLDRYDNLQFDIHPGVGTGTEKRFETREMTGFELIYENHLIHITALNLNPRY